MGTGDAYPGNRPARPLTTQGQTRASGAGQLALGHRCGQTGAVASNRDSGVGPESGLTRRPAQGRVSQPVMMRGLGLRKVATERDGNHTSPP